MNKTITAIAISLAALSIPLQARGDETGEHHATAMSIAQQGNRALQEVSLDAALNMRIDARESTHLHLALRRHEITGSMTASLNP